MTHMATTWTPVDKSNPSTPETDFVFSDGSDFVFSDSTDFVFVEGTNSVVWSPLTKNSTSWDALVKS